MWIYHGEAKETGGGGGRRRACACAVRPVGEIRLRRGEEEGLVEQAARRPPPAELAASRVGQLGGHVDRAAVPLRAPKMIMKPSKTVIM